MLKKNYVNNDVTETKKLRQEVVIKMTDDTVFCARIFIGFKENMIDLLHDERHFIPVELENHQIILIAKKSIMAIDLFQKQSEKSSTFTNTLEDSFLYQLKHNDTKNFNNNTSQQDPIDIRLTAEMMHAKHIDSLKCYDEIYERYTHIVKILNNPVFKERRQADKQFDDNINSIIDALRVTSSLLEKTRKI